MENFIFRAVRISEDKFHQISRTAITHMWAGTSSNLIHQTLPNLNFRVGSVDVVKSNQDSPLSETMVSRQMVKYILRKNGFN